MSDYTFKHLVVKDHPLRTLLRYNRRYWKPLLIGIGLTSTSAVLLICTPLLIGYVIDLLDDNAIDAQGMWFYFALMLLVSAVGGVCRYFQRVLMIGASRKFEYDLRNDFFQHLQTLSPQFFNSNKTGDIMARATNDLGYVREFIGPGIKGTVDMLRVPFTIGIMLWYSVKLTLFTLIPLPFVTFLAFFFIRYMNKQSKIVQKRFAVVNSRAQEKLAGARVVKAYGIAGREMKIFRQASESYMRANIKLAVVMTIAIPMVSLVLGAIIIILVWQGGTMVINKELSTGDLAAFFVCMLMLAFPLGQFGYVLTLYQRGAVAMNRIGTIMCEEPHIRDTDATREDAVITGGAITFDAVRFAHGDRDVLEDISFTVPAGQTLAIVGPTGSGKTSIISLLTRAYDLASGQIAIDGHALSEIPLDHLRGSLGYVSQDPFIFSSSIRENLLLARPDASEAELLQACELAQLTETLDNLPDGLDTLLGERGVNLSGGQKQRLTLARALVRDPGILILDDSLSSVDTHTEEQILSGLRKVMAQRTTILIAHRISTVQDADYIIVLDQGRISEQGTHDSLIAAKGLYASMYRRQQLEIALEDAS